MKSYLFAVAALSLSLSTAAQAAIATHVGDNDPTTEGWTANDVTEAGNSVGAAAGPSWQVVDGSNADAAYYSNTFTLAELPTDWVQTVTVQVASSTGPNGVFSAVTDASTLFYFFYDASTLYYGENTNLNPVAVFAVNNTVFHTYDFAYDSVNDEIDISLDGNYQTSLARSAFYQSASGSASQYFGSGNSTQTSDSRWGLVTLAEVPEPTGVALLGLASLMALRRRRA